MSGFSELVGAGAAECATGNPISGLMKQFDRDRSLEQDRYGPVHAGPSSSKQAFRQAFRPNVPGPSAALAGTDRMADEFHRQMHAPHQAGASAFDFQDFQRELSGAAKVGPGPASANWIDDFARHAAAPPSQSYAEFEKVFQHHMRHPPPVPISATAPHISNWSAEFARLHASGPALHPGMVAAIPAPPLNQDDALKRAFAEARLHAVQSQPASATVSSAASSDRDKLARLAGKVLGSVEDTANPKFKTSEFFGLMKKLRDGDVVIHENKIAESTSGVGDWATEFSTIGSGSKGKQADPTSWAAEFGQRVEGLTNQAGLAKSGDPTIWSEEFAKSKEKDWAEEFEATLEGPHKDIPVAASPRDWAEEFKHKEEMAAMDEAFNNATGGEQDWVAQYRKNIAPLLDEHDEEWEGVQKAWETHHAGAMGYRATDPALNMYSFQRENPFEQRSLAELTATIEQIQRDPTSASLGDAILALEAKVHQEPQDAKAWTLLGIKQQENEQEQAAIAALRKAISIDPDALDAHIALAVSYTNENYHADAYDELHEWIARHPKYRSVIPPDAAERMQSPAGRKEYVQDLYLQAARMAPGQEWDPDVQVALGVLFNISEEYEKAIDCFRAALSKRPSDYVIWNKLGATLANARRAPEATDAYFKALELQPSYIRARYNLAIASINMNHHREAAEHLLGALALQHREGQRPLGSTVPADGSGASGAGGSSNTSGFIPAGTMSNNIWETLKMTMYMMNMPDLARACDHQNMDAFRQSFDF